LKDDELAELQHQALAGRVARDLAHEVNNLLMGVVGAAPCARGAGRLEDLRAALETSIECGQKMADLIRAFQIAFASPGHDKCDNGIDLAAALERAALLCGRRVRNQGVEVKREDGNLPRVQGNIAVERTLVELLHDALDGMPRGGTLRLIAEPVGNFVTVTVTSGDPEAQPTADSGPGGRSDGGPAAAGGSRSEGAPPVYRTLGETPRLTVLFPIHNGNSAG
jgi:C4-dicarboxylate-specific signal transduction histidine kinase